MNRIEKCQQAAQPGLLQKLSIEIITELLQQNLLRTERWLHRYYFVIVLAESSKRSRSFDGLIQRTKAIHQPGCERVGCT